MKQYQSRLTQFSKYRFAQNIDQNEGGHREDYPPPYIITLVVTYHASNSTGKRRDLTALKRDSAEVLHRRRSVLFGCVRSRLMKSVGY